MNKRQRKKLSKIEQPKVSKGRSRAIAKATHKMEISELRKSAHGMDWLEQLRQFTELQSDISLKYNSVDSYIISSIRPNVNGRVQQIAKRIPELELDELPWVTNCKSVDKLIEDIASFDTGILTLARLYCDRESTFYDNIGYAFEYMDERNSLFEDLAKEIKRQYESNLDPRLAYENVHNYMDHYISKVFEAYYDERMNDFIPSVGDNDGYEMTAEDATRLLSNMRRRDK